MIEDILNLLAFMLLTHFGSVLVALTIIICTIHLSKRITNLENVISHTPTHTQMDIPIENIPPETPQAKPKRTRKKKETKPPQQETAPKESIEEKLAELAKGDTK